MTVTTRKDDELLLAALDLRDNEGVTCSQLAKRFGGTKNSWVGKLNRVDGAMDPTRFMDGTMPRRWWA